MKLQEQRYIEALEKLTVTMAFLMYGSQAFGMPKPLEEAVQELAKAREKMEE